MEMDSGIILRVVPFKEKDAMITAMTPDGYRSFFARNVFDLRGKNAPALQKYTEVELALREGPSGGRYLNRATIIYSASKAMRSLARMSALEICGEAVLKAIIEAEDVRLIYPYLQHAIKEISEAGNPLSQVLIIFAQILKINGYGLNVDYCIYCNSPKDIVAIDYQRGGYICKNCFEHQLTAKTGKEQLMISRFIFRCAPADMERAIFSPEEALVIYRELLQALGEQLGIYLQSAKLFAESIRN
jgi:DNA repair protein RecO